MATKSTLALYPRESKSVVPVVEVFAVIKEEARSNSK